MICLEIELSIKFHICQLRNATGLQNIRRFKQKHSIRITKHTSPSFLHKKYAISANQPNIRSEKLHHDILIDYIYATNKNQDIVNLPLIPTRMTARSHLEGASNQRSNKYHDCPLLSKYQEAYHKHPSDVSYQKLQHLQTSRTV